MRYEFNADSIRKLASMLRRTINHGAAIHCERLLAGQTLTTTETEALSIAVRRCAKRAIESRRSSGNRWDAMYRMLGTVSGGGETCTRPISL